MPPNLLATADRFYRLLLKAYPPAFQARFAREMTQVYRALYRETGRAQGTAGVLRLLGSTLWDWGWAVIAQWWAQRNRKGEIISMEKLDTRDGIRPLSVWQAAAAALPFLLFGISSLASKMAFSRPFPASLPLWQTLFVFPYLVFNLLVLIGLGIGILRGFPRWSFAYLGWAVLFAWWSDMGFYGYTFDWKMWPPLLGMILVALLIRRSWQPLRNLFHGLWTDWTLLSFSLYILYVHIYMLADENHHPLLALFIAATTLGACLGAWGYFRSASPLLRILALVAGLFAVSLLGAVNNATWDYRAYYGLPGGKSEISSTGALLLIGLAAFMLGNALLVRWRLRREGRLRKL